MSTGEGVIRLRKAHAHVQRARTGAYAALMQLSSEPHTSTLSVLIHEVMDDLDQALAMMEPST